MFSILFLPLIVLVGIPASIGALHCAVGLYHWLTKRFSKQTSFIVMLCAMAVPMAAFTAPYWILGGWGWLTLVGAYVFFVAMGGKQTWRIIQFIKRELDGDPTNDVPLPDDEKVTTTGGPGTNGAESGDGTK